jgi:hypothetical protein
VAVMNVIKALTEADILYKMGHNNISRITLIMHNSHQSGVTNIKAYLFNGYGTWNITYDLATAIDHTISSKGYIRIGNTNMDKAEYLMSLLEGDLKGINYSIIWID